VSVTFEESMLIISTVLLLPAIVGLIAFVARNPTFGGEHWNPIDFPERNWWDEEGSP
jgi:hypothetical protein